MRATAYLHSNFVIKKTKKKEKNVKVEEKESYQAIGAKRVVLHFNV